MYGSFIHCPTHYHSKHKTMKKNKKWCMYACGLVCGIWCMLMLNTDDACVTETHVAHITHMTHSTSIEWSVVWFTLSHSHSHSHSRFNHINIHINININIAANSNRNSGVTLYIDIYYFLKVSCSICSFVDCCSCLLHCQHDVQVRVQMWVQRMKNRQKRKLK